MSHKDKLHHGWVPPNIDHPKRSTIFDRKEEFYGMPVSVEHLETVTIEIIDEATDMTSFWDRMREGWYRERWPLTTAILDAERSRIYDKAIPDNDAKPQDESSGVLLFRRNGGHGKPRS